MHRWLGVRGHRARRECPVCKCELRGSSMRADTKQCMGLRKLVHTWPGGGEVHRGGAGVVPGVTDEVRDEVDDEDDEMLEPVD